MSRKWLMWAACGLMVLGGVYLLWSRGYQNVLGLGMLLLCPLSHLLMMRGGHDHGSHDQTSDNANGEATRRKPACH